MTDTALFADYVLPAASFLEFDDLVFPYFHNTISAQCKAVEPLGESLSNMEIFRRLSSSMHFTEDDLYETDGSLIAKLLSQTSYDGDFDGLKKVGTSGDTRKPNIQFEGLKFKTPSGRIEVASVRLEAGGHPIVPSPHADAGPAAGKLRVLSPASKWLMNSSYGNDEAIRSRLAEPKVFLSVRECERRGLANGDKVALRNDAGALRLVVESSAEVPDGVALVHKGRWPLASGDSVNVNVLNRGLKSDIGSSTAVHGVEAELVRI
jgi:anaerobic selenocysteine-containing dehydrogenase